MDHYIELMLDDTQVRASLDDEPQRARTLWTSSEHNHAGWELHILLNGRCRVDLEHESCPLHAHEGLLIAPGQYHRANSMQGDLDRFTVIFSPQDGALVDALHKIIPSHRVFPVTKEIEDLCRSTYREQNIHGPFRKTALQCLTSLLLIRVFSLLKISEEHKDNSHFLQRKYTELIDAFFEEHVSRPITMDTLAQHLHLSRTHVNRILKKHYNVTFREKLIRTRMARAAWLLRNTSDRVDQIADAVGYSSISAFHEMFRKHFAMSPEKYRYHTDRRSDK